MVHGKLEIHLEEQNDYSNTYIVLYRLTGYVYVRILSTHS